MSLVANRTLRLRGAVKRPFRSGGYVRLFMFAKFKDFLNSLKSKLLQFLALGFSLRRLVGILCKSWFIWMVIVTTILLPCLINASLLFGGQVVSEDLKSFQVAVDIPMEKKFTEVAGTTSL